MHVYIVRWYIGNSAITLIWYDLCYVYNNGEEYRMMWGNSEIWHGSCKHLLFSFTDWSIISHIVNEICCKLCDNTEVVPWCLCGKTALVKLFHWMIKDR